jgi:hypothetical protein
MPRSSAAAAAFTTKVVRHLSVQLRGCLLLRACVAATACGTTASASISLATASSSSRLLGRLLSSYLLGLGVRGAFGSQYLRQSEDGEVYVTRSLRLLADVLLAALASKTAST